MFVISGCPGDARSRGDKISTTSKHLVDDKHETAISYSLDRVVLHFDKMQKRYKPITQLNDIEKFTF